MQHSSMERRRNARVQRLRHPTPRAPDAAQQSRKSGAKVKGACRVQPEVTEPEVAGVVFDPKVGVWRLA
jgi:hypothetical protein